jgi:N-acetylmuramic acid 6-phosphate (MurNAc-6-P) etherase
MLLLEFAASGTTPYVIGGLQAMKIILSLVASLVMPLVRYHKQHIFPVDVVVGPEFVTGSSE